jgi:TRAP-type C4-dicarboxylate transport system permease small subunit
MTAIAARALDGLDALARFGVALAMGCMVTVVTAQVVLRYVFNDSIDWAEETARLLFVWTIFLAIPPGVRGGVHIGVNLLVQHLPAALQAGLHRATALLGIGLMLVVAWGAARVMPDQWDELLPTLPQSVGWQLVPVFLSMVHSALHLAALVVAGPPADAPLSAERAHERPRDVRLLRPRDAGSG